MATLQTSDIPSRPSEADSSPRNLIRLPEVNIVSASAPKAWLMAGLNDMKQAPMASLLYGLIFAVTGMILFALAAQNPVFVVTLTTGFLLVGPFVAVGLYAMSQHIEQGEYPTLKDAFSALKFNAVSLVSFALLLGIIMTIWTRTTALMTGLFFNDATIATQGWAALATNPQSYDFILAFVGAGFILAAFSFAVSVVSIPMMTHRKVDVVTAIITSLKAVAKNPLPMIIWAGMIVALIALGTAFFYVGLIITLPLVGHASWHAYRALVRDE